MSQLYISHDTLLKCTEGRRIQKMEVTSQSSLYLVGGTRLMATEEDRFNDNFICPKMMLAGAVAGAALAAMLVSTGPFALAAGALAGSVLVDDVLNVCSLLCKGSQWSEVHPKVKVQGKKALMEKARIKCFFGGEVHFEIFSQAEIQRLKDAAAMADDSYNDNNSATIGDFERVDTSNQKVLDKLLGENTFEPKDFDTNQDNGFYASLYQNSKTGEYFVAFRGSEAGDQFFKDWIQEDVGQGVGFVTEQVKKTQELAEKMNNAAPGKVSFTGHSLGGGNSAMASYYTGRPGYTFNARGIHPNSLKYLDSFENCKGTTKSIHAYNSSNDILNFLQNHREGIFGLIGSKFPKTGALLWLNDSLPRALGEQNEINIGGLNFSNIGSGHGDYQKALEAVFSSMNTTVYSQQL